ncbi:MAG: hypothetical protein A2Y94_12990 [Caldithrix sp. RBG_13_44_9]|nr:MAG: hypothetical protein A2Y94_12990 [Caldithrix sp. RBG_13_44_9]
MRPLLLILLIIGLVFSCQRSVPDQSARDNSALLDTVEEDMYANLPPVEFFQDNYQTATQVLLVKISQKSTADKIYADDGELGYIVQQLTGQVLKVYKGEFMVGEEITYYNFLEYSPGIEERFIDSVLIFLQIDPESGRLSAIEAGQFDWNKELSALMENEILK